MECQQGNFFDITWWSQNSPLDVVRAKLIKQMIVVEMDRSMWLCHKDISDGFGVVEEKEWRYGSMQKWREQKFES